MAGRHCKVGMWTQPFVECQMSNVKNKFVQRIFAKTFNALNRLVLQEQECFSDCQ